MFSMTKMREHSKWILWGIVILVGWTFVVYMSPGSFRSKSRGPGEIEDVAVVAGKPITYREYYFALEQSKRSMEQMYGLELNENMITAFDLRHKTVEQLIQTELLTLEARKSGLKVSDEEIEKVLYKHPYFLDNDGRFSSTKYQELLKNPRFDMNQLCNEIEKELLMQRFMQETLSRVFVSDEETLEAYRRQNQQLQAKYVVVKADDFTAKVMPNPEALSAYYESHKDDYRIEAKLEANYAAIPVTPSEQDLAPAKAKADEVLKKLGSGGDFAALAEEYIQDETLAKRQGALDPYGEKQLNKPILDAIKDLKPGEYTKQPFFVLNSLSIMKLDGKEPDPETKEMKYRLRVIPFPVEISETTKEAAQKRADELQKAAETQKNLKAAAKAMNSVTYSTGTINRDRTGLNPDEPTEAQLPISELFTYSQGQITKTIPSGDYIYVAEITKKEDARVPPLDEVREKVQKDYTGVEAQSLARQYADSVAAEAKSLEELVAKHPDLKDKVKTTELFTLEGTPLKGISAGKAFADAAYVLPDEKLSEPVAGTKEFYLLEVTERKPIDEKKFDAEKEKLHETLLQGEQMKYLTAYLAQLRQKYTKQITINEKLLQPPPAETETAEGTPAAA